MKIQKVFFLYLTIGAVIMSLLLSANAVQAEDVIFDPASPQRAIGITNLNVDGTLYDVEFITQTTALSVYGDVPGDFDFPSNDSAGVAVNLVNGALNAAGAIYVGTAGGENTDLAKIYEIGYAYQFVPIGSLDAVLVWKGSNPDGTWLRPSDPDPLSWYFDERTYADFTEVTVCTPATECTEGFECGIDADGCGGAISCGICGEGEVCDFDNRCDTFTANASIMGIVLDADGVGVRDVLMTLSGGASDTLLTNIIGAYSFTLTNGTYTVTPSLGGYTFSPTSIDDIVVASADVPNLDFTATSSDCIPVTECLPGFECGEQNDGCGDTIDCGTCSGEDTCEANVCVPPACIPATECTIGFECGTDDNGCDGTIDCGTCSGQDTCVDNICIDSCTPKTQCSAEYECGTEDDGCGSTIDCGTCTAECGSTASCVENICEKELPNGHNDYCAAYGPCTEGEGDCDGDSECESGLTCVPDVGTNYGWPSNVDVCQQRPYPGDNYCRDNGPCSEGEGDCDGDSECESGLICAPDVGANYGWPSNVDVCEPELNCIPATECTAGFNCGEESDGCDGTIDCGTCSGEDTCVDNICVDDNLVGIIDYYCEEVAQDTADANEALGNAYLDMQECGVQYDNCLYDLIFQDPMDCFADFIECLGNGIQDVADTCFDFKQRLADATTRALEETAEQGLEDEFIQFLYSPAGEECLAGAKDTILFCEELSSDE